LGSLVRVERSHRYDKILNEPYRIWGILKSESNYKWLVQKKNVEGKLADLMIKQLKNSIVIMICVVVIRLVLVSQHSNVKKLLEISYVSPFQRQEIIK